MADITLLAESGRTIGSRPARRLRADGRIPGVLYGPGVAPISVSVSARDLRGALSTEAGLNAVLSLSVDGKKYVTMARELQRHPVRGSVTHVDFQVVDPNREVSADVPITLVGEAVEVNRADGVLEQQMFSLTVRSRPADIPTHIEVDVSELVIGAAVRVSDLTLPAEVTTDVDPESIIAAGQPPRVQIEEVPEGEAAEGEAAEGEAPAAEGGASAEAESSSGGESGGES
jgi:large subunit ribosomal protein L25